MGKQEQSPLSAQGLTNDLLSIMKKDGGFYPFHTPDLPFWDGFRPQCALS
jgi:hypothetical protein